MLLIHKIETVGDFPDLVALALNGDELVLSDHPVDDWGMFQQGIVTKEGLNVFLNGSIPLHTMTKAQAKNHDLHPKGVVIKHNDQLLLNGKTVLYRGDFDDWKIAYNGEIVIERNGELLFDNKVFWQGSFDDWEGDPVNGFVIQDDNRLLLSGTQLLFQGSWDNWRIYGQSVIIETVDEMTLLINGRTPLYDGYLAEWCCCEHGLVIEDDDKITLYVLKQ